MGGASAAARASAPCLSTWRRASRAARGPPGLTGGPVTERAFLGKTLREIGYTSPGPIWPGFGGGASEQSVAALADVDTLPMPVVTQTNLCGR